ncbi:MAG TPA: hypothetical protein VFN09_09410, partial [Rhodanobacteraceae bacterium]|nr:hypothetical protein [Rhodanobacteraceae bacterium]
MKHTQVLAPQGFAAVCPASRQTAIISGFPFRRSRPTKVLQAELSMSDVSVVIVGSKRTAIGSFLGQFT